MTRPDLRTPRPGELLRAAGQSKETASARQPRPWAAANTTAGLRAIDREMIYLDEKAMQAVAEARAEITQAQEDIAGARGVLAALGTAETDEDITLALADYLAIDPAEVSFIGSMSDAVVAQIVITDDIVTENMIATGAVTAQALNVVSTSGTGHSWRLDQTGLIAMHTSSQEAMHIDSGGIRMWDATGSLTVRINGVQNYFEGEFRTVKPGGGRGVIINNTVQGDPGVWLTSTGGGGYNVPGIMLRGSDELFVQEQHRARYKGWRYGVVTGNVTNARNGERGPGPLSWSSNADAPFNVDSESVLVRERGYYTITFSPLFTTRPSAGTRVFLKMNRNASELARAPMGEENLGNLTWSGVLLAGDRIEFATYWAGTGTYTQGSTISIIYHGD